MHSFRGHYVYGATPPDHFIKSTTASGVIFGVHPNLPFSLSGDALLIGLVFDYKNPGATIHDILARIATDPVGHTGSLAGRWVLILPGLAMSDACGTMPILWTTQGQLALSSSAQLLQAALPSLEPNDLISPEQERRRLESESGLAFPGGMTEYKTVRALLPNHLLQLNDRVESRFHPSSLYKQFRSSEVAPEVAGILTKIVSAASTRNDLVIALTAGHDSRAILGAASKVAGLVDRTGFFTFVDRFCPPGHFDLVGAKRLAEIAGGDHKEIFPKEGLPSISSESTPSIKFESWAREMHENPYFKGRLGISGWCSEIGRAFIRWDGSDNATVTDLMNCANFLGVEEFRPEFEHWMAEAKAVHDQTGINILDLFYWEFRVGRWVSSCLGILNSAQDWVSLYSCRDLLDLMLSVQESERGGECQQLYRAVISELDPRLLSVPINPFPISTQIKRRVKSAARSLAKRIGLI